MPSGALAVSPAAAAGQHSCLRAARARARRRRGVAAPRARRVRPAACRKKPARSAPCVRRRCGGTALLGARCRRRERARRARRGRGARQRARGASGRAAEAAGALDEPGRAPRRAARVGWASAGDDRAEGRPGPADSGGEDGSDRQGDGLHLVRSRGSRGGSVLRLGLPGQRRSGRRARPGRLSFGKGRRCAARPLPAVRHPVHRAQRRSGLPADPGLFVPSRDREPGGDRPLLERDRRPWRARERMRLVPGPLGRELADRAAHAPGGDRRGRRGGTPGLRRDDDHEEARRGGDRRRAAGRSRAARPRAERPPQCPTDQGRRETWAWASPTSLRARGSSGE